MSEKRDADREEDQTQPESRVDIVEACYTLTDVDRFEGNPFIEALPPFEQSKSAYLTMLSHLPPIPTDATRNRGEVSRIMELSMLSDIVIPFPEYQRPAALRSARTSCSRRVVRSSMSGTPFATYSGRTQR